jgi:hypothetical protein
MYRNSAVLSIGAALVFSLFFFGVGHAFQIDRNQDAHILMAGQMKGTADLPIKQVSNAPTPCGGRTGTLCSKTSLPGSGEMATLGSRYTTHVSNTPIPCGGRTGTPCRQQIPQESRAPAIDGSLYTSGSMLVPLPLVGILFGAGLIALVGFGVRGWRHLHGHHDGQHA